MSNPEHVEIVKRGREALAHWREGNPNGRLDLRDADLSHAQLFDLNLSEAYFDGACLSGAMLSRSRLLRTSLSNVDLSDAHLVRADLFGANLQNAIMRDAKLNRADFCAANMKRADLEGADLCDASLVEANLAGANLQSVDLRNTVFNAVCMGKANMSDARLSGTTLNNIDLSRVQNLGHARHFSQSTIGVDTLFKSNGAIPDEFLRGAGINPIVQHLLIGNTKSKTDAFYRWVEAPITLDNCFISYSTVDKRFVDKLQSALNDRGVDYWYAPEHGRWGQELETQIDRQISLRDRVIVVCSSASLYESEWVQKEIALAVREESRRNKTILFPVMIDDAFLKWAHPNAMRLREILAGDFRQAKEGQAFEEAVDRLYQALYKQDIRATVSESITGEGG